MGRSTGAVALQLETGRDNAVARALYESSGWKCDEEHEHYEFLL